MEGSSSLFLSEAENNISSNVVIALTSWSLQTARLTDLEFCQQLLSSELIL